MHVRALDTLKAIVITALGSIHTSRSCHESPPTVASRAVNVGVIATRERQLSLTENRRSGVRDSSTIAHMSEPMKGHNPISMLSNLPLRTRLQCCRVFRPSWRLRKLDISAPNGRVPPNMDVDLLFARTTTVDVDETVRNWSVKVRTSERHMRLEIG
jgi:hypothetical protein